MIDSSRMDESADDRAPRRLEADQLLCGQTPAPSAGAVRPGNNQSAKRTKAAIRRLLVKFNAARAEAESILRKLNEISQRITQLFPGGRQGPST